MSALADLLAERGIVLRHARLGEHRAPCPECDRGPRDDALAVRLDLTIAVWTCHRCSWRGAVGYDGPTHEYRPPSERLTEPERRHETLAPWGLKLWQASRPIEPGTVAARYLEGRGCRLPPPDGDLRWHPELQDRVSSFCGPALVALMTDPVSGKATSIHRTWLARDGSGKASIPRPRRILKAHPAAGIVRLWPDEEITLGLVIGEGIETCLAGARAGLMPVWACLNAANLAAFPVLPGLEGIIVLVDHDRPNPKTGTRAGIAAALAVMQRYSDAGLDPERDINAILPPTEGQDAADLGAAA
jgi:putative DNA primase/helicase